MTFILIFRFSYYPHCNHYVCVFVPMMTSAVSRDIVNEGGDYRRAGMPAAIM